MKETIELIRGLVRPTVTWITILALVAILGFLVWKFGDAEMAKTVLVAFTTLVTAITSFWFASRSAKPPNNGG